MLDGRIVVNIVKAAGALRDQLVARLATQADVFVAAIADRAHAGRMQVMASKPDVVLVNAALGGTDAINLIEHIAADSPATKVIVIDVPPVREAVTCFLRAGARGFVAKDAAIGTYERAIRSVMAGGYVVPPELIEATRAAGNGAPVLHGNNAVLSSVHMTQRERDIATLMVTGASDEDIGASLSMSLDTLEAHVRNILEKLVLHTRLQVAALAMPARAGRTLRARTR